MRHYKTKIKKDNFNYYWIYVGDIQTNYYSAEKKYLEKFINTDKWKTDYEFYNDHANMCANVIKSGGSIMHLVLHIYDKEAIEIKKTDI